jgi:flagellar hook-basal body complex protein FliE
MPITPIHAPVALPGLLPVVARPDSATGSSAPFGSVLADAIQNVDRFQQNAQTSIGKFLAGEDEEVHKVALATEQASMSLDLFLQVRNKVVSAYQEVMRMQM